MSVLTLLVLLTSRLPALANGAVFELGTETSTPVPVQQSELYLHKEHVVFRENKVVARFWVQNPSERDIAVQMGFPLSHGYRDERGPVNDETKIRLLEKISSQVKISSEGKPFPLEMNEQEQGPYRVTFLWRMNFPAGKLTEFTVEYPMDRTWGQADGIGDNSEFVYITHTGASWARPIGEALFEYYDEDLVEFITTYYPGLWWEDAQTQLEVGYVISPQPYTLDTDEGKIVWKRTDWVPRKNKDDIRVAIKWRYNVGAPGVDTHTSDPSSFGLLCGDEYPEDAGRSKHFAETTRLETVKYNQQTFQSEILYEAYKYRQRHAAYPAISEHMRIAEQLEVLKYLRNYLAARHGHTFKDEGLAECYRNVKPKKSWSDAEKANLQLVQELEKSLAIEYKNAVARIKDEMLDMELFRDALLGWKYKEYGENRPHHPEKKMATE
jgi:hypothetical protein